MPRYTVIDSFKSGLDTRRSVLTSVPGSLQTLENAHINQGGEIEKREAFTIDTTTSFPLCTFGLEATDAGLVTFGSVSAATAGTMPTINGKTVTYQQLVHPGTTYGGTGAYMTAVPWSTNYNGKAVVAATFSDGATFLYYDGKIIEQSWEGVVLAGLSSVSALATGLARAITRETEAWTVVANALTGNPEQITGTTTYRSCTSTGIATLTFSTLPAFAVGDFVYVSGLGGSGYNGFAQLTSVESVAKIITYNTNQITAESNTADSGGTVTRAILKAGQVWTETPISNYNSPVVIKTSANGILGVCNDMADGKGVVGTNAAASFLVQSVSTNEVFTITAPSSVGGASVTLATVTAESNSIPLLVRSIVDTINLFTTSTGYTAALGITHANFTVFAPVSWGSTPNGVSQVTVTWSGAGESDVVGGAATTLLTVTCPEVKGSLSIYWLFLGYHTVTTVAAAPMVTGGLAPYGYHWEPATTGSNNGLTISDASIANPCFTGICEAWTNATINGTYKLTVTDKAGTIVSIIVTVTVKLEASVGD